jgi:glycosyltransferase involved in cell wall biosynthesis
MQIMVPRLMDETNLNAQNLNARSLLSRFGRQECVWHCVRYGKADPAVSRNRNVKVTKLLPWRAWPWHMVFFYQRPADAIFYPGVEWFDPIGLRWRDRTCRSIPVIATLEGLGGDTKREKLVSQIAGHPVYCQQVSPQRLAWLDYVMRRADHIIAISPFLGKIARQLYGDKCSVLPMGIDSEVFGPSTRPKSNQRKKVLSVGNVRSHKRPEIFLNLAAQFREVEFRWIGEGDQRSALAEEASRRKLQNLSFPGSYTRQQIAEEMQTADVLVMPSRSEGVPKVTQEAAASGVPCIVFGFYEAPTVVDGQNGYVVWSDGEFAQRLAELLNNAALRNKMARRGREFACAWDWNVVSAQWEQRLMEIIGDCVNADRSQQS